MPPLAGIIIVNWNNWHDTLACVESCKKLVWPNFLIIIVDNGSTDGSENLLGQHCPDVDLLQAGSNLGFAGGNNIGIRHALSLGADFIWLLNNDTIVDPYALSALIEALETNPVASIAGSKILRHDPPDIIWSAGGSWSKGRLKLRERGQRCLDDGRYDEMIPIGSVSGCSLMVRSRDLHELGLMNESYFLYWEDTDWCARAQKLGHSVLFVPRSKVWHKISSTVTAHSELQYYYFTRNGCSFCLQHDMLSLPLFLIYVTTDVFYRRLRGNRMLLKGYQKGIIDFFRGHMGQRNFTYSDDTHRDAL